MIIQIHDELRCLSGTQAHCLQLGGEGSGQTRVGIQLRKARAAGRTRRVSLHAFFLEQKKIGLDGSEALAGCLAGSSGEIFERRHGGPVNDFTIKEFGPFGAYDTAPRPVKRDRLAHGPAEEFIDRHAQRLGFDVEAGIKDSGIGMGLEAASPGSAHRLQDGIKVIDGARIFAYQRLAKAHDE